MGYDLCGTCVRRARHEGGNASCPVFDHRQVLRDGVMVKEPIEEAWARHRALWPSGCSNYKVGDRRNHLQVAAPPQEPLF